MAKKKGGITMYGFNNIIIHDSTSYHWLNWTNFYVQI